jgi:uncharacterized coiled-coil protein SlyX
MTDNGGHMAKTQTTTDLSDLDERISELSQQVKERFSTLKQQVSAQQREMERLSEQHERLTGKALLQLNGSEGPKAGPKAASKRKGKRTRLPSPTVDWLQETLAKKGMTVKQLQEKAAEDNLSGLKIAALLKEGKSKFKAEAGKKDEGKKGKPAMVWGVKG